MKSFANEKSSFETLNRKSVLGQYWIRFCNLLSKILLFTFFVVPNVSASPISAGVQVDFVTGEIDIEPAIPEVRDGNYTIGRSKCWGICFGRFTFGGEARKKGIRDTYFFLEGDPDNLRFYLVNMVCSGPHLIAVNYIQHRFNVLKGQFNIQGNFASNSVIVAHVLPNILWELASNFDGFSEFVDGKVPMGYSYPASKPEHYINYACGNEFRNKFANHSLSSLDSNFGEEFSSKFDGDVIEITWDAKNWKDSLEKESLSTIKKAKLLLNLN